MMQLGIIGKSLTHSFSPTYFNEKMKTLNISGRYDTFELSDIQLFPTLIRSKPQLIGLNVTIPYKESIIPYLDVLDSSAITVGAVNCIVIENGILIGYNTDALGFQQALLEIPKAHTMHALVLGTGGAARAVWTALDNLNISYKKVSRVHRADTIPYEALCKEIIDEHYLIINTTPLGMYPEVDKYPPIPYDLLSAKHVLFDLIYNPENTKYMQKGSVRGAQVLNGLQMLINQAEINWKIWNYTK